MFQMILRIPREMRVHPHRHTAQTHTRTRTHTCTHKRLAIHTQAPPPNTHTHTPTHANASYTPTDTHTDGYGHWLTSKFISPFAEIGESVTYLLHLLTSCLSKSPGIGDSVRTHFQCCVLRGPLCDGWLSRLTVELWRDTYPPATTMSLGHPGLQLIFIPSAQGQWNPSDTRLPHLKYHSSITVAPLHPGPHVSCHRSGAVENCLYASPACITFLTQPEVHKHHKNEAKLYWSFESLIAKALCSFNLPPHMFEWMKA